MVTRIALIQIISIISWTACGAFCQNELPPAGLLQRDSSNPPEARQQEMRAWKLLPDAPSVQPPTQAEKFQPLADAARSRSALRTVSFNSGGVRETELGHVSSGPQPGFAALYRAASVRKNSSTFFGKYLYPSSLQQKLRYHASTSGSFMGRAAYAASRIFVRRDESGKGKLNSSYFLGVLTSVAVHTAYRPYWARSSSATFNNVGSTIGSDAGMNLLHEFEPGMRQMVKGHTSRFVGKIEERTTHEQNPRGVVSTPAR
jgi:hypothetical protein